MSKHVLKIKSHALTRCESSIGTSGLRFFFLLLFWLLKSCALRLLLLHSSKSSSSSPFISPFALISPPLLRSCASKLAAVAASPLLVAGDDDKDDCDGGGAVLRSSRRVQCKRPGVPRSSKSCSDGRAPCNDCKKNGVIVDEILEEDSQSEVWRKNEETEK